MMSDYDYPISTWHRHQSDVFMLCNEAGEEQGINAASTSPRLAFKPTGPLSALPLGRNGKQRWNASLVISASAIHTQFSFLRMWRPSDTGASSV